jgi:hypothetical protein
MQIDKEELVPVINARTKAIEAATIAEKAVNNAKMADMEFKLSIQQLYIEKGLLQGCRVDITTGGVAWPEDDIKGSEEDIKIPETIIDDVPAKSTKPTKQPKKASRKKAT